MPVAATPRKRNFLIGDEKKVLLNNSAHRRQRLVVEETSELTPRADLYQTITVEYYLRSLNKEILLKNKPSLINRWKIMFYRDNARPHTAKATLSKLQELGLKIMSHPGYYIVQSLFSGQNFPILVLRIKAFWRGN